MKTLSGFLDSHLHHIRGPAIAALYWFYVLPKHHLPLYQNIAITLICTGLFVFFTIEE